MTFSRSHFSTLIKYIGISFITGAISHGFFSGTRSLITGGFGILCFVIGTMLEDDASNTWKTILAGAILAVGIGSVTGGFQHFPDSPERSLWIIPFGYVISILFFGYIHHYKLGKKEYRYIILSSIVMLLMTAGIYALLKTLEARGASPASATSTIQYASGNILNNTPIDPESVPGHHN